MTVIQPPEFLQVKNQHYDAARMRWLLRGLIGEGTGSSGDLAVTQRAAGADRSVDVAAGRAWVEGDDTARQGIYHAQNDAVVNVAHAANATGDPRIDRVVLRAYDSTVIGGARDEAAIEVVQGTPTAGATLVNLSGAAAVPPTALLLANVLVTAGATTIVNAQIGDVAPVAPLGASGAGGPREIQLYDPLSATQWANMPAAKTELLASTLYRHAFDFSGFSQARMVALTTVAGSASSELRAEYDPSVAFGAPAYLDGAAGPGVTLAGAVGVRRGAWVDLAAGAKADVYLRAVGISGDGVTDPSIGRVTLQVR